MRPQWSSIFVALITGIRLSCTSGTWQIDLILRAEHNAIVDFDQFGLSRAYPDH